MTPWRARIRTDRAGPGSRFRGALPGPSARQIRQGIGSEEAIRRYAELTSPQYQRSEVSPSPARCSDFHYDRGKDTRFSASWTATIGCGISTGRRPGNVWDLYHRREVCRSGILAHSFVPRIALGDYRQVRNAAGIGSWYEDAAPCFCLCKIEKLGRPEEAETVLQAALRDFETLADWLRNILRSARYWTVDARQVYVAKSRVTGRLRAEMAGLCEAYEDAGGVVPCCTTPMRHACPSRWIV